MSYVTPATTAPADLSGGSTSFVDDFLFAANGISITTGSTYNGDTPWAAIQISGGTQTIASSVGTVQNPGAMTITTSATTGQGCAFFKGGGGSATGPLGALGNNIGWQVDIWAELPATITNYCARLGLAKGGLAAGDAPTSGLWWEYDTANTGNSDTKWTIRTVSGGVSNYSAAGPAPAASTWYHFRIRSVTAGTILFSVGAGNAALGAETAISTDVPSTDAMMPWFQVLARSNAAVTLIMDRYSYTAPTGRV